MTVLKTNLTIRNSTALNDRFADLFLDYVPLRWRRFTVNQAALGFINAMKNEALKDCNEYVTSYDFTDTEYEDDTVRIRINAVAGGPERQLVRCNYLHAIKTLAIDLMTDEPLYGASFTERYHGQLLYHGIFGNKYDLVAPSVEQFDHSPANASRTDTQEKRALGSQSSDSKSVTSTLLVIPGSNDPDYRIGFEFLGNPLLNVAIFSAILEFMMTLAQLDSSEIIENDVSQATFIDSSWIFVMPQSESSIPLQRFQLLAILESIARHAVNRGQYQEMTFTFFANTELVASGCVTAPNPASSWCRGLSQLSLSGNFSSKSSILTQI